MELHSAHPQPDQNGGRSSSRAAENTYPDPPAHLSLDSGRSQADTQAEQTADSGDPHDPLADLKRTRACEPCRQLKVRCDPDPNHPDGSCKRCAKARRTCVVTAPTRKRQKKTDSRVTELERKIDALTASLQMSHSGGLLPPGQPSQQPQPQLQHVQQHQSELQSSHRWEPSLAGNKRQHDSELKEVSSGSGYLAPQYSSPDNSSAEKNYERSPSRHWRGPYSGDTVPPKAEAANEYVDCIDRGMVTVQLAEAAFDLYIKKMAPQYPMVVFPTDTTMSDIRRSKPALFLAITAAAIGPLSPDLQVPLFTEFYRMIAERVVVKGEKALELCQGLLVCCIWYLPPDNFEELKFYQLIHMASTLAMDLGMNRRSLTTKKGFNFLRELMGKKTNPSFDPDGPEARRTWVACYFLSVQVSAALRRTQLVRWQPYMDECVEILETHPDALPSDKDLLSWAKLGYIMEEASLSVPSEEIISIMSFSESKLRYTMKGLANKLNQWKRETPEERTSVLMSNTEHIINLYLHEITLNVDCNNSKELEDPSSPAAMAFVDALTTCIHCIHKSLDTILSFEIDQFIILPTTSLARTSYAIVSLIKLYSLLTSPDNRLGQIVDVKSLKMEYYLDRVLAHYRAGAARDGGRAAAKFAHILGMLRNWFLKKKDQGPGLREELARAEGAGERKPERTPLHLLSEVAVGDPLHRTSSGGFSHSPPMASEQGRHLSASTAIGNPGPSTPGQSSIGTSATSPGSLQRMTTSTTVSDTSAGWPSFQSSRDPAMPNRSFYAPFTSSADPSSTYATQQGYGEMSSLGMNPGQSEQSMGMVPEFGMETIFDPSNFWALGNLMDEGLFNFPLSFDPNLEFY